MAKRNSTIKTKSSIRLQNSTAMHLPRKYSSLYFLVILLIVLGFCISSSHDGMTQTMKNDGTTKSRALSPGCCVAPSPKYVDNYYSFFGSFSIEFFLCTKNLIAKISKDIVSYPFMTALYFIRYFFSSFSQIDEYVMANNLCKFPSNIGNFLYESITQTKIQHIAAVMSLYFSYFAPNVDPSSPKSGFIRLDNRTISDTNSTGWERVGCLCYCASHSLNPI